MVAPREVLNASISCSPGAGATRRLFARCGECQTAPSATEMRVKRVELWAGQECDWVEEVEEWACGLSARCKMSR